MVPSTTSARHNKSLLGVSPPHPHHYHQQQQKQQQQRHLLEAISLLLSRWNGLQMAIQNQWGGHDSLQKSHQLEIDIFSWFSQSKALLCVEDLENLLHECMLFSFNTEIEDGSIEEVAEQLMVMHEEYVHIIL